MQRRRKGELHEVLSPEAVAILAGYFGAGRSIFVPAQNAFAERFEILIGAVETAALVQAFGGTSVYLPGLAPNDGTPRAPSPAQVAKLDRQRPRPTARAIAKQFGCSVRLVYKRRAMNARRKRPTCQSPC